VTGSAMSGEGLHTGEYLFEVTEREAVDHIEGLKQTKGCDDCPDHPSLVRAQIFNTRVLLATQKKIDGLPDKIAHKLNGKPKLKLPGGIELEGRDGMRFAATAMMFYILGKLQGWW
jgi:hypothetical protein